MMDAYEHDHELIDRADRILKRTRGLIDALAKQARTNEGDAGLCELSDGLTDLLSPRSFAGYHEMIDDADPEVQAERQREFEHQTAMRMAI